MQIRPNISDFLKRSMLEKDISIKRLSEELDIPKSTLFDWLNGTSPKLNEKTLKNLAKVAQYFGVSVSTILFKESDEKNDLQKIIHTGFFQDMTGNYKIIVEKVHK